MPLTDPSSLLAELAELGLTVTETFPYAAELGRWLMADEPGWWRIFEITEPELATLPLAQARFFAFLEFCERQEELAVALTARLDRYLRDGPRHLRDELANTVAWYRRQTTNHW
jgi:hypothetical protein